jgi:hypothetical protein
MALNLIGRLHLPYRLNRFQQITPKGLRSGILDQNSQVKGVRPDELWRDPFTGAEGATSRVFVYEVYGSGTKSLRQKDRGEGLDLVCADISGTSTYCPNFLVL